MNGSEYSRQAPQLLATDTLSPRESARRQALAALEQGEAARITCVLTRASDAATTRAIQNATETLGAPPATFAFMALGSAGRDEETFSSDQDNAIVYSTGNGAAAEYFGKLGEAVCTALDGAGYPFCHGDVMTRNPKWRQTLPGFEELFARWTVEISDQDLLDLSSFLDFRCVYGDPTLVTTLRRFVCATVRDKPRFLFHLAMSMLQFKPPVTFLGNPQIESDGEHTGTFNIKSAIVPFSSFARIYALYHGLEETSTWARLRTLQRADVLQKTSHDEYAHAFSELMRMRLKHQAAQVNAGQRADDYIPEGNLTHLDRVLLKQILSHIAVLQNRVRTDFARTA